MTVRLLRISVFLMAFSAIVYELLLASILGYLLGSTVTYFSLTIGFYLFSLGIGAWWSGMLPDDGLLRRFIRYELVLALLGVLAAPFLLYVYAFLFETVSAGEYFDLSAFMYAGGIAELMFHAISFLLVCAVGILVGLELPIATRLFEKVRSLPGALSAAFWWDYLGSLAGSIAFSLLLLPTLGFVRAGVVVGLVNVLAAWLLLRGATHEHTPRFAAAIAGAGIAVAAIAFGVYVFSPRYEDFIYRKIFAVDTILNKTDSPYQEIVLAEGGGSVALYLAGEKQFATGTSTARYHETFAKPALSALGHSARRVLILGGGDGLLAREVLAQAEVEEVTLVDIDRRMTDLAAADPVMRAANGDSLSDPRLSVVTADAFRWLLHRREAHDYDLILADFPDPTDRALSRLFSKEIYRLMMRSLDEKGLMVAQATIAPSPSLRAIETTVAAAGFHTQIFHPREPDPALDIPGVYEFAFVAGSAATDTITTLRMTLVSSDTASAEPSLAQEGAGEPSINTVMRPSLSFGDASLVARVFDRVVAKTGLDRFFTNATTTRAQMTEAIRTGAWHPSMRTRAS